MFTGLIKSLGKIVASVPRDGGRELRVDVSGLGAEPAIGASIALSGACQTVTACAAGVAVFFAAPETIRRTTLGDKRPGEFLNLEPALRVGDALDGRPVDVAEGVEAQQVSHRRDFQLALEQARTGGSHTGQILYVGIPRHRGQM